MTAKEHFNFTITDEPVLTYPAYEIDEKARILLEKTYFQVTKKKGNEKDLIKYVKQYPHLPQFKNRLATFYMMKGQKEKASEINMLTVRQFPDYLFGKVNVALDYYYTKEFSKIPEILGEQLQLDKLYPGRKSFHLSEVMAYYKVVAIYLNAVDKTKQAWEIIHQMNHIYQDRPETNEAINEIYNFNLSRWPESFLKNQQSETTIKGSFVQSVPKTNKPPDFENALVTEIYKYNFRIPSAILQQLLLLPEESLQRDLKKAIYDGIARYEFFLENDVLPEETFSFLLHAIFIIAEKKWTSLLSDIFAVLKNGESFNEFYFGDILTELIWIAWYKLGKENVAPLFDFLKELNICTYSKTGFNKALVQLYWQNKNLRQPIENGYRQLASYFIEHKQDNSLTDTVVIASTACAMRDILQDEPESCRLENALKQLYDHNLVSLGYAGDYESLMDHPGTEEQLTEKIPDIFEMYQNVVATWAGYKEEELEGDGTDEEEFPCVTRNQNCPSYAPSQK